MTYKEAIAYLDSLGENRINLGLSRVKILLFLMQAFPKELKIIHIAGTNGKGSVAEMASSMLAAAGFKTGVYTSPHLRDFRERILVKSSVNVSTCQRVRVKRELIPKRTLAEMTEKIKPLVEKIAKTKAGKPTFFEVTTAIMFAYFASEKTDIAVIETGLGGRLDATNVVDPLVSIITGIGLEHTDRLGNTLGKIAFEKSGIIKQGRPVVTAETKPEALSVIKKICRLRNARLIRVKEFVGQAFRLAGKNRDTVFFNPRGFRNGSERFDYRGISLNLENLAVPLPGEHQAANASCALAAIELISRQSKDTVSGIQCPVSSLRKGLSASRWPARCEVISRKPVIILDGAHNPPAACVLRDTIKRRFKSRNIVLLLGVLGDKDAKGILQALVPVAGTVILTMPENERAVDPLELASALPSGCRPDIFCVRDPRLGFRHARRIAGPYDLILVTGSLYLAGRGFLRERNKKDNI